MPVAAVDTDLRSDAYKKTKPIDGIDEQGLVPDPPEVMHVLALLMELLQKSSGKSSNSPFCISASRM